MAAQVAGLTMQDYEKAIRIYAHMPNLVAEVAKLPFYRGSARSAIAPARS